MHSEPLTVVARAGSGIKTIMDLKGKRVNIGNPGSVQRDAMNVLMAELGWDTSTFAAISELDPHANATGGIADNRLNASAELCEDKVDAVVFAESNPNPYIREASIFCDIVLVDVSGPAVDKLVAEHYYYVATTIPGGTYQGTPDDTKTFGAVATLMSSLFVEHDVIYEAIKAVFENFDRFKRLHAEADALRAKARAGLEQRLGHLGEGHQAWAGHFVELASVARFGQCSDRHVSDILDVDDRFRDVAAGHRQNPGQHRFAQVAFAEVLREPGGAHDGEVRAGVAHNLFTKTGVMLSPARQQDQMFDTGGASGAAQRVELVDGAGKGRRLHHPRCRRPSARGGARPVRRRAVRTTVPRPQRQ